MPAGAGNPDIARLTPLLPMQHCHVLSALTADAINLGVHQQLDAERKAPTQATSGRAVVPQVISLIGYCPLETHISLWGKPQIDRQLAYRQIGFILGRRATGQRSFYYTRVDSPAFTSQFARLTYSASLAGHSRYGQGRYLQGVDSSA